MPWISISAEQLAKELGIDFAEVRQKHDLIKKIISARKKKGLTQSQLAKKLGVSQARIAKIESRVDAHRVSFDILFSILAVLGYSCKVVVAKSRSNGLSRIAA